MEAKNVAKIVKENTSAVRAHLSAVERARTIYLAAIRRAETEYFERIKQATALITGEEPAVDGQSAPASEPQPEQTPAN
jgi:hypothetical protein